MKSTPLTQICRPTQWKTISSTELQPTGFPVYGANGKIGFYSEYTHEYPTILITCRGATCGTINVCEPKSYVNGNAMALDNLSAEVDISFLTHFLRMRGMSDVISGSAQPQITRQNLHKVEIPLPSLAEQQRIAAILDAADAHRQKTKALLEKYDQLAQGIFLEMFGNIHRNERNWEVRNLGNLCSTRLGKMLDGKKQTGLMPKPYLRNTNVQWGRFDLTSVHEMDFSEAEQIEFRLKVGDVLVCEGGEVGRAAIWKGEMEECYFQKAIHRIRVDAKQLNGHYLVWWLKEMARIGGFKDYVSSVTIAHLTGVSLRSMKVALPPIELQNQFGDCMTEIAAQREMAAIEIEKSEALFQSLLQGAFSGELK